jgi:hypothetical protein
MYDMTLHALKAAKIERMWFVVSMKLARLHVDAKHVAQACAAIDELHKSCTLPGSEADDPAKAAQLIEIYAMRIEVGTEWETLRVLPRVYMVVGSACPSGETS